MRDRDWVGSGGGFLFVALTVVGLAVGGNHPDPTGSVQTIRAYFLHDPFSIETGSYVQAVAAIPFVMFAVAIAGRLWLAGRQSVAAIAVAAAVLLAVLGLIENALLSVLAFDVASGGDDGAILALYSLRQPILLNYLYFPWALFAFALAIGSLTSRVLPRWYGWISIVMGILFLVGASDPFVIGTNGLLRIPSGVGFLLLVLEALWLLLTSGLLLGKPHLRASSPSLPVP